MPFSSALFWFRRDLRLDDNVGLAAALSESERVDAVFVFDRAILDRLEDPADRRVDFIWQAVAALRERLQALGGRLHVRHEDATQAIPRLAAELGVEAVFSNHDYEPEAVARDHKVAQALDALGIAFQTYKDQVIFERSEVLTTQGKPYTVFTPYKKAWLQRLSAEDVRPHPLRTEGLRRADPSPLVAMPSLESLGFRSGVLDTTRIQASEAGAQALLADFLTRIDRYHEARDYPAVKGPSYLSVHLRFGTISIRQLVREAWKRWQEGSRGAEVWLSELIWREFYMQLLAHFPQVVTQSFKPEFDRIVWREDPQGFAAWCEGRTGYPIVDAAMRQLNQTGYMHNRLRMIAASFLCKDLLIDWRRGERYFAAKLLDYDLAANNGGWQWAASTGCDAQPYFRIFNPVSQSERFDPEGRFIRRYVPELAKLPAADIHAPWRMRPVDAQAIGFELGRDYPEPIVDHASARAQALAAYKHAAAERSART